MLSAVVSFFVSLPSVLPACSPPCARCGWPHPPRPASGAGVRTCMSIVRDSSRSSVSQTSFMIRSRPAPPPGCFKTDAAASIPCRSAHRGCAESDRAGHIVQHDLTEMRWTLVFFLRAERPRGAARPHAEINSMMPNGLQMKSSAPWSRPLTTSISLVFGRDHNDRQVCAGGVGAQLAQDLVAVLIGQHHIQNDQLPGLAHGSPEAGGVLSAACVIAVGLQRVLLQLTDAGVALDNEIIVNTSCVVIKKASPFSSCPRSGLMRGGVPNTAR